MKRIVLPFLLITGTFCIGQVNLNQRIKTFYPFSDSANNLNSKNTHGSNTTSCTNWLSLPNNPSYATIGDLDVVGTQLTVEATMNRIPPLNSGFYYGHVVSKHTGPENINYALSLTGCEITTTNGYKFTNVICDPELNKTYHIAMVYDGTTLKFYRNGFLMSAVPCTGNMITNDLLTTIGEVAGNGYPFNNQVLGYLNEVRVWNVARTQAQLRTYMNASLPSPTTQPGLLGYYTFDDLLNKQGNATYNVTLNGGATINNTNPSCVFFADSCLTTTVIGNIVNDYTPVLSLNPCDNKLTVEDGTKYNTGDTVLLIQMKGAIIDSTNTAAFGAITNYKNAGNYEFNYVKSKTGNQIELLNSLTRQYDLPDGKVQLIRVPYYQNATISSTLTCLPWDGNKGGVLVLNVQDSVILNANIDVTGKGFGRGVMHNSNFNGYTCGISDYYYQDNTIYAAGKGEGITKLSTAKNSGKGPAANGGGGGMDTNSGGGGGSNGNLGGRGGYELNLCPNYLTSQNWGLPGKGLLYNNVENKIFLGGGGGAGHCNNQYYAPNENADFNGGNGGGLIIINSNYLLNNNNKIIAKGDSAYELNLPLSFVSHDGMGGGGAGGTIILNINNYINNLSVDVSGGKGGDMVSMPAGGLIGPGGGGGGGAVWLKQNNVPVNLNITNIGGKGGVIVQDGNNPYGTTSGLNGINIFNLVIPVDVIPFKMNIDSVRIKDSAITCNAFNFKGLAFTNNAAITNWLWFFGDGSTDNTQNTTHNYLTNGATTVKLIVTDINGCKDSIAKPIIFSVVNANSGNDTLICNNNPVILKGSGTGISFAWTPKAFLNDSTLQNPTAIINATTKFYLTVKNLLGCSEKDSVTLSVRPDPVFSVSPAASTCFGSSAQLNATGGNVYLWSPANLVSNAAIPNPLTVTGATTNYSVTITENICNTSSTLFTTITVNPVPQVTAAKSNDIDCSLNFSNLLATGAQQYTWSPVTGLNNTSIYNPIAKPVTTTQYIVTGTNAFGCSGADTLTVAVTTTGKSGYYMPNTFSPNGDGKNDCFGITNWGIVQQLEFSIFNRYGERVFYTTDPNKCWNGLYKSNKPTPGNYVYYIKAVTTCGPVEKKDNVILIR